MSLNDATPIEAEILDYLEMHRDKRQAVLRSLITIGYVTLIKRMSDSEAMLAAVDPLLLAALAPHLIGPGPLPTNSRTVAKVQPVTAEQAPAPALTPMSTPSSQVAQTARPQKNEQENQAPAETPAGSGDDEALADFPPEIEAGGLPAPAGGPTTSASALEKLKRMGALDDGD